LGTWPLVGVVGGCRLWVAGNLSITPGTGTTGGGQCGGGQCGWGSGVVR